MAFIVQGGHRRWEGSRDSEGHREYKVVHLVVGEVTDGPANAMNAVGLPAVGSAWLFLDDTDVWAWCRPDMKVTRVQGDDPNSPGVYMEVEQVFSTRPLKQCQNDNIENPLLTPPKVSGSSVRYTEEATHDKFGFEILSSSHEAIRGPIVEFDRNRPQIKIEMNLATDPTPLIAEYIDKVNSVEMWGLPPRCIKLSGAPWQRLFYGTCFPYYQVNFEFDINFESFDRFALDEGTKVLNGEWTPWGSYRVKNVGDLEADPENPSHFIRFRDLKGDLSRVILDGKGLPAGACIENLTSFTIPTRPKIVSVTIINPRDGDVFSFYFTDPAGAEGTFHISVNPAESGNATEFAERIVTGFTGPVLNYFAVPSLVPDPDGSGFESATILFTGYDGQFWRLTGDVQKGDPASAVTPYMLIDTLQTQGGGSAGTGTGCDPTDEAGEIFIAHYQERDLRLLGIPLVW